MYADVLFLSRALKLIGTLREKDAKCPIVVLTAQG